MVFLILISAHSVTDFASNAAAALAAEAPEALVCNGNLGRHCDEAAAVPESRLSYGGCTGDTVLDACHMATI